MNDLATIPCPACGRPAEEVIHAKSVEMKGTRVGWYCPACKHFKPAEWRERSVE